MKMVKKILLGLAVAAIALALTGCGKQLGDPNVKINGSTGKASIDHTNETDSTQRAMKIYLTKHLSTNCAFVIENQTTGSYDGQLGYAFNLDKNTDCTYNFITVGFRNNKGTTDTYVSAFFNIKESSFSTDNFGVEEIYGTSSNKTKTIDQFDITTVKGNGVPSEVEISELPTILSGFSINSDKQLIGDITAEDNGSYTIKFYNESQLDITKNNSGNKITGIKIKTSNPGDPKKIITVDKKYTGYSAATQAQLGVYAGIYRNATLTGAWFASDLEGNPIPAEFEN